MRKIQKFRGNAVQLDKLTFDYESLTLEATFSLVDSKDDSAVVVGYTRCLSWDDKTKEMLAKFVDQLEKDAGSQMGGSTSKFSKTSILEALGDTDES